MTSNAQDPNKEIIEESSTPSTPVTSPPTAAVETISSTGSIQTDNPQSGSVKMAAANFNIPPLAKFDPKTYVIGNNANDIYDSQTKMSNKNLKIILRENLV